MGRPEFDKCVRDAALRHDESLDGAVEQYEECLEDQQDAFEDERDKCPKCAQDFTGFVDCWTDYQDSANSAMETLGVDLDACFWTHVNPL